MAKGRVPTPKYPVLPQEAGLRGHHLSQVLGKFELAADLLNETFSKQIAVGWCSHENGLGGETTPQVTIIVGLLSATEWRTWYALRPYLKRDLLRIELILDLPPVVFPDAVRVSERQRNKSRSQVQRFDNIAPHLYSRRRAPHLYSRLPQ